MRREQRQPPAPLPWTAIVSTIARDLGAIAVGRIKAAVYAKVLPVIEWIERQEIEPEEVPDNVVPLRPPEPPAPVIQGPPPPMLVWRCIDCWGEGEGPGICPDCGVDYIQTTPSQAMPMAHHKEPEQPKPALVPPEPERELSNDEIWKRWNNQLQ